VSQVQSGPEPPEEVSGWALSGIAFAGIIMILIGIFEALAGFVAIVDDDFYVVTQNYTFDLDTSAWGWVHLIVGLGLIAVGYFLLIRRPWAGVVAVVLAMLSAILNFFFIPYYPLWSLLQIALAVWVIWSITRAGAMEA
jgi:hypothetical protein